MTINAQEYFTQVHADKIGTLKVHPTEKWDSSPVIKLNSDETIRISFDLLTINPEYMTYRIIHCNSDWKQSSLSEFEYMTGVQNNQVSDYANSFLTQPDYVNYQLQIPNNLNQLTVSGNYAVEVFDEQGDLVLDACFSVVEPLLKVNMQVSSITDKGFNNRYQAVSFEILYGNEVRTPSQDLKVFVKQNNRRDNQAANVKHISLQGNKAVYDHNPALIFDAGNEYRYFEMTTVQYAGQNIEAIEFHPPFYHIILRPDVLRSNRSYLFYNDLNGYVYIHNRKYDDSDLESDYRIVHFYIPCDKPFVEDVYILSEAFNFNLNSRSRMEYSLQDKGYIKSALLKEGYYNYLYVTQKDARSPGSTALTEGNFYETENEYQVLVYLRSFGTQYDRLVGVQTVKFGQ